MLKAFKTIFDPIGQPQTWTPSATTFQNPNEETLRTAMHSHKETHQHSPQSPNEATFHCISDGVFLSTASDAATKKGLFPYAAEVGDMVVMLLDGNAPYIPIPTVRPLVAGAEAR